MKFLILAVFVACASAVPVEQTAQILRSDYEQSPEGNFQYAYESDNGISSQVQGVVKQVGKDEVAVVQTGSSQYKSPEGELIQISFVADENGYQPQGAHLPTPPTPQPYPDHVVRSLAYIAAHPYVDSKKY